jgi:hypothetical protein
MERTVKPSSGRTEAYLLDFAVMAACHRLRNWHVTNPLKTPQGPIDAHSPHAFHRIANSVFGDAIDPSNYAAPMRR